MTAGRARRLHPPFDCVLVGGGLQNALAALALLGRRPGTRLALVERARTLGGNHRWSFHRDDVPSAMREAVAPLVETSWPGYEVRFPGFARTLDSAYATFDGARLHRVVAGAFEQAPGSLLVTGCGAASVGAHLVALEDGRVLEGALVLDARGPERFAGAPAGYQKFLGLEVELAEPRAPRRPLVMDAAVAQHDGFRFVYVLPLAPDRLLVEDTYFSDSPALDASLLRERVAGYCRRQELPPFRVLREERGVLPLPQRLGERPPAASPLAAGYQGGWFHPTTGYSLPAAARLADLVATLGPDALEDAAGRATFVRHLRAHRRQARFCMVLNRMLFRWFAGGDRWQVLARFYRLPEDLIARFYAMTTTPADRARIVCGHPPRGLSLGRAIGAGRGA